MRLVSIRPFSNQRPNRCRCGAAHDVNVHDIALVCSAVDCVSNCCRVTRHGWVYTNNAIEVLCIIRMTRSACNQRTRFSHSINCASDAHRVEDCIFCDIEVLVNQRPFGGTSLIADRSKTRSSPSVKESILIWGIILSKWLLRLSPKGFPILWIVCVF